MKGKRFLSRTLVCGLSVLMVLTPSPDMVFAQNLSQDTEEVVTEVEEVTETESEEVMTEQDTETADVQEKFENTQAIDEKVEDEASEMLENVTATNVVAKGTDGNISWSLDSEGHLKITGTGNTSCPWLDYKEQIKTATVEVSGITSVFGFFSECTNLTSADFSKSDFSKCTNMSYMFNGCSSLARLDVSNFDTSNVTDMSCMFYNCAELKQLDVSNFDTGNVTEMPYLFYNCAGLKQLDVSNFNTSKVTGMSGMFFNCSGLKKLDVSNFDTSNVKNIAGMFNKCSGLTSLDVSNFDTSNVTSMLVMFSGCSNLTKLDLSSFNTSKVTNMYHMFSECSSLTKLNLCNFNTGKVVNMQGMFSGCSNLTKLDLTSFNTGNVIFMNSMFSECSSLTKLGLNTFNTSNVKEMDAMFANCSSLTKLNLSSFDMENLQESANMLQGVRDLQELYTPKNVPAAVSLPKILYDASGTSYKKLPMNQKSSLKLTAVNSSNQGVTYKVVFDGNGSTSGSMKNQSIKYGTGTKLTANTFKRKGYTFKGWNTKADGSGKDYADKADGSKLSKKNGSSVTLYAQWKKKNYTITYNLNNGTNAKENPAKYNIKTATITLKNPTRKGYTFKGWYTDSNYKNQIKQIKKGSTGNKTLYAKWSANKYTVTFDANHKKATGKTKAITCKYGKKYTLTSNGFKRKGYTFKGWNTKKDGSGKTYKNKVQIKNLTSKSNGKVVLYAQWKKKK